MKTLLGQEIPHHNVDQIFQHDAYGKEDHLSFERFVLTIAKNKLL